MDALAEPSLAGLCRAVDALVPRIRSRAPALDRDAAFPAEDLAELEAAGARIAPFPRALGGLGLGTDPAAAASTAAVFQSLGYAHVAVARLFEAHVNAVRLLALYGNPALVRRAAADAEFIGLWVTDPAASPAHLGGDGVLAGGKQFCSGAGHLRRAVVTARRPDGGDQLLYLAIDPARASPLPYRLEGVRSATTGQVDLAGLRTTAADHLGDPGDYLREPAFSAGAWRTSAATAGALAALADAMIDALAARGRTAAPAQAERIGRALVARETARLWIEHVAPIAEDPESTDAVATVGLARVAIETAALDTLRLAERAVGLPAFLEGSDLARLRRDLATYLRQPALDEVILQSAAHEVARRHGP